jgi:hypothetical protein
VVTLLAIVASVAACGFALLAWKQHRDAVRRSEARVAALTTAIDWQGPFADAGLDPGRTGVFEPPARSGALDVFAHEHSGDQAPLFRSETPSFRGWMIAAAAVPVALVIAALLVTRGPRTTPAAPTLHQPETLELLAMRHDTSGDSLTVTGTVRVRGRDAAPVTAVVTGRDDAGRVVASAHAPLDDAGLDLGGESSFQVTVPGGHDVRRYQVRFETPLGPLTHIDRRGGPGAAPVQP